LRRLSGGCADILPLLAARTKQKLSAFVRRGYDTHASVPAGTTRDPQFDRRVDLGLTYKPTWNTAFRRLRDSSRAAGGGVGEGEDWSGIGYQF
jgi:hypothetical protein